MAIQEQSIDSNGLYIKGADGRMVTLLQEDVHAYFMVHGSADTIAWAKGLIQAGLGDGQISLDEMTLVLDGAGNLLSFGTEAI